MTSSLESIPEPNPVPKLTIADYFQIGVAYCLRAPWTVFTTLLRRWSPWSTYRPPPLREHLFRHVITCLSNNTPRQLWDNVADRTGNDLFTSTRYAHLKNQIYQPIRKPEFSGFWICRGLSSESIHPREADLVILHCHGGGYVSFHPSAGAPEYLFAAELLQKHDVKTAIFSLDYTLAPKATFPTQIDEALAAFDWINGELGVDASKIVVTGDSAGGHLALSLLVRLHQRHITQTKTGNEGTYNKPGGALLVSPWVNLFTSHPRTLALHWEDRLWKMGLDKCCAEVLQDDTSGKLGELYGNFAAETSTRGSWKEILPQRTWVSAGSEELVFLYDIEDFVAHAQKDGADVSFEVAPGKDHTWQCSEGLAQHEKLLSMKPGEDEEGLMVGYRRIADVMLSFADRSS